MNKREIKGYFREMFLFDMKRERIIYSYLCREKLSKKQRKLLTDETRFGSYQSWKAYIVSRYEVYTKESLLEFSRAINQFLRESKQFNEYHRNVVIAYISYRKSKFKGSGGYALCKLKCSFLTSCKQSYPQFHEIASDTHSHNADDYGIPLILYILLNRILFF